MAAALAAACVVFGQTAVVPKDLSRFEFTEPHMGTIFRIVLYAGDESTAQAASTAAFARIADLDRALTDYEPTSELSRVTREAVGRPVKVSDGLLAVLLPAQELAERSEGAFDITVGPLTRLWRRARREVELPPADGVEAARLVIGYRLLHVDANARTVQVDRPGMQLDAGGIAKGFAADAALAVLKRVGIGSALVAAGGDLAVGDPPPGGSGWKIALAGLDSDRPPPSSPIVISHAGVSTSGDAEQWVQIGGVRYSHILDPRTGRAVEGHTSVTVVASDATSSDMLATAVSVLGPDAGRQLIDGWKDASALVGVRDAAGDRWVQSKNWR